MRILSLNINKMQSRWLCILFSLSKNLFFDRLTEVKEAVKTNKPNPSAYIGTVGFELCCKSKCLVKQDVFLILRDGKPVPYFFTPHPSKIKDFCHLLLEEKAFVRLSLEFCVLTVWGFFDTLKLNV